MKKIKQALTILICLAALSASAGDDFAQRLKAASTATRTIECDFTLIRTMSVMAGDVVSRGHFYYMRGSGIALLFSQPAGDEITLGRERFRIVSAGKKTVVKIDSNPMLRQLQTMLTACMTGNVELLGRGAQLDVKSSAGNYVVRVTPADRRARNMMKLITLTFDGTDMSLQTLRMEEPSGDVSQYSFFDKKFNGAVSAARFDVK